MSCDSEDDELKLTKNYKYLLSYIRPLIEKLDKSKDAQLCLLWLSKLEQCKSWERCYRNKILFELCKQVKANSLRPPFNTSPPSGCLRDLVCDDRITPTLKNDECSEGEISTEETMSSSTQYSKNKFRKRHSLMVPWKERSFSCIARNKQPTKPVKETADHSECFAIQKAYHERAQSDQMVIEKYQDIIKSLVSQQLKADISPSKLKRLQSTYEMKMTQLVHTLKKLQEENSLLKQKIESTNADSSRIEGLKAQNDSLRQQICELESAKNLLENQYKKAEDEKIMTLTNLVEKLNESEKRLKDTEKRFQTLEKKYEENCQSCQVSEQNLTEEKENKYKSEVTELEKLLEEKQVEINDLEKQTKYLKSRTRKLEKLRDHMAVLFESHLQQILSKKDFYIATLEMQLKMNSLEAGRNHLGSDLHAALNQKVTELESQYRRLLQESEQQFMKRRQLDLQKIHILEKQLLKFGEVIEDSQLAVGHLKTRSLTSVTAMEKEKKQDENNLS